MKRKRIFAAALACLLLLLSACGASGTSTALNPASPATLTLWHYYVGENQQALERAVDAFNQTLGIEKGVIIEAVAKGSIAELEEAVTASAKGVINADPMPDIFSSYPDKAMEIDALGKVCDLNAYFTEEEKQAYVESFLADGVFDGDRLLLIPIVKSTELFYVNATTWDAFAQSAGLGADALATWEQTYATARAYYEWTDAQTPDTPWDGKSFMGFDSVANYIISGAKQLGLDVIDAGGRQAVLDNDVLRRLFDIYYEGHSLGYFGATGKFRSDDIKAGDLVAYVGSSSSAAYFPTWIEEDNTQKPISFLPLAYPAFQGGTQYAIQQGAGMCVASSTPQKQEGAALFLKWFTDAEQNIEFAMTTGYLPVKTSAYASDAFDAALESLRTGDAAQNNVAGVYEIALHQITELNTYAAKPFEGSYSVRSVLQSTLIAMGEAGRQQAEALIAAGSQQVTAARVLTADEVLENLDVPARFEEWLTQVRAELDAKGIAYTG